MAKMMKISGSLMALATVLASCPAAAQVADASAQSGAGDAVDPGAGDIIVTAQRRAENVQKIPVAVAVVGGETLANTNAVSIANLTGLVPSMTFTAGNETRNASIRIRGVGTDVFSTGVEPSVSVVVDGVVLQRPGSAFSDLGDIERVEVLRGPQGTLFGKNSSAGVVNIITKAPNFDRVEVNIGALVAENNEYRVNGAVSGPLSEKVAVRVAGFGRTQGGISRNLFDNDDINGASSYGGRLKLALEPTDAVKILLEGDYYHLDADCCALPLRVATNNPKALNTGTAVGPNNRDVNNDVDPYAIQTNYGFAATVDLSIGDYTLTSISAYRRFKFRGDIDLDDTQARLVTSNAVQERSRTTTQEIRLTSPRGRLIDFVLGAYYFDGSTYAPLDRRGLNIAGVSSINPDGTIVPNVPGDVAVLAGYSIVDVINKSVFGQANLHLADRLTLTGGLRYLKEDQRLRFLRPLPGFFNGINAPVTNPALGPLDRRYHDNALIGKASLTYEISDTVTSYVSYSTGYKSEGIAATLGLTAAQFAAGAAPAETSRLWEAGLKTQMFDRRLTLNLTGFRTRFSNYQGQVYNSALGLVALTSVGGVKIDGFELEATARPAPGLTFNGGVTYLAAEFYNVPNGPCFTGQTVAQGCAPNAQGVSVQNLNGKPFLNAPKWRYTMSGRYEIPLEGAIQPYIQADWRWQSRVLFDLAQNPNQVQRSYGIFDATIGAKFGEGRYDIGFFAKNLFDRQYVDSIITTPSAGGANAYSQQLPRDFSRYVGATLRVQFN